MTLNYAKIILFIVAQTIPVITDDKLTPETACSSDRNCNGLWRLASAPHWAGSE